MYKDLCKSIGTEETVCIRKEFKTRRIGLGHQLICMAAVTSCENTLCKASWLPNCSHKINLRRDLFCKRFVDQ